MASSSDRLNYKNLKVTWRFGTGRGTKIDEAFTNAMATQVVEKAKANLGIRVSEIQRQLTAVITNSYKQAYSFALRSLLGRNSSAKTLTIDFFQYRDDYTGRNFSVANQKGFTTKEFPQIGHVASAIKWDPLTMKHIRRKTGRLTKGVKYNKEYWNFRGELIPEMRQLGRQAVLGLGTPAITVRKIGKKTQAARQNFVQTHDLKIRLMPNITRSSIPGIATNDVSRVNHNMKFEEALGFSKDAIDKLRGPIDSGGQLVHRPFFQPVFTYWTLFHIPNEIARAINQATRRSNAPRSE